MELSDISILSALIFLAAAVYSSVGHAGASGYLAAMALFGLAPEVMRPTALVLNILVASLATYRLYRAGLVDIRALLPFVVLSVPMAFAGGMIHLPGHWYRILIGLVLAFAALRLVFAAPENAADKTPVHAPRAPAAIMGGTIGLLSGLTGTGGGIFLTPLLIFLKWAGARQAAGISAPFILVNSAAGLAGNMQSIGALPATLPYFVAAALAGAFLGTHMGIRRFSPVTLRRVLAMVMIVAAAKFLMT